MKTIQKSSIPKSNIFVIKELNALHFDPDWHFHPEYQLFVVLEGKGTRFIGDSIKPFKEGDMVFMGPNLPHIWRSDHAYFAKNKLLRTRGIVIYLQENFLGGPIDQIEEMAKIHYLFQRSSRGLEVKGITNKQVTKMIISLTTLKGVESIIQLLKILDTLAKSKDCLPIAHAGYVNLYKENEKDRMNKVIAYVMKNFKNKISLNEVADLANMTHTSFSRYFRSRVNKSFSKFLCEVRIDHACKLLHEDEKSIIQVSFESGFNTLSNFNKQFKDLKGQTPLMYKKEYTKQLL